MTRVYTVVDSPIDPITLIAEDGALCALFMHTHKGRPNGATFGAYDERAFVPIVKQLYEYFEGGRTTFDVTLAPIGNTFKRLVWRALCSIPYGKTASYGEIAARIGKPGAARAVGMINGQNPISIIVPCHRVIGANGNLTGYGGGLDRKAFLLELEKRWSKPKLFV